MNTDNSKCHFVTKFNIKKIYETDILENNLEEINNNINDFNLTFVGNEIKTLKILL